MATYGHALRVLAEAEHPRPADVDTRTHEKWVRSNFRTLLSLCKPGC